MIGKLNNFTIRNLLLSTAVGILMVMVLIGIITWVHIENTQRHHRLLSQIDNIARCELMVQKAQRDFLLREVINPGFFETGRSKYVARFDSLMGIVNSELSTIKGNSIIASMQLNREISSIIYSMGTYRNDFMDLTKIIKDKGFKNYGIEGKLRDAIHQVESKLADMSNYRYTTTMLMLRRHEKDYLLRKELRYRDQFKDRIGQFIAELNANRTKTNMEIVELLKAYNDLFMELVEKDILIGITDKEGLMARLNLGAEAMEHSLESVRTEMVNYSNRAVSRAKVTLFLLFGVIAFVSSLVILRVARHITKSVKRLRKYISRLGEGELPEQIRVSGKDEIASMEESINVLTENLKSTRNFAIEVGNGNLETEVNVFNNEGDLGGALIEMRKKLLQVARERERQELEAKERLWTNEGLALFANTIRQKNQGVRELAFAVIQNLVKYTGSNQAGFFMVNTDEEGNRFIELIAAYAYNRRKYCDKRLEMNEGIIGACIFEAETTLLTDIPNNYLQITSGLGQANPRCLALVPIKSEKEVLGVIEIASFTTYQPYQVAFLERIAEMVAHSILTVKINEQTALLLEQTKIQAEELTSQEEELRQNMEELQATQEQMVLREQELHDQLLAKEQEIIRIQELNSRDLTVLKRRLHEFESISNVVDSTFLYAEFEPSGTLLKANRNYREAIRMDDKPTIFSGYVPDEEEINRLEWRRVVSGESYRGFIHRVNPNGEVVEIFAGLFPVNDANNQLDRVICIGHNAGVIAGNRTGKPHGTWVREFITLGELVGDNNAVWS